MDGCRSYDLEVHMVHQNSENKSAVVGILYTIGQPDTFLSEVCFHHFSIVELLDYKIMVCNQGADMWISATPK